MPELERWRQATMDRLGTAYARGQLTTDSLEFRLESALAAAEPGGLEATLWGLPGRWVPRAAVLRIGGELLAPSTERAVWVVGRSRTCDVRVTDAAVSARHVRIACRGGRWTVADLGSLNGTWVNGARVEHAVLEPGDELAVGGLVAQLTG